MDEASSIVYTKKIRLTLTYKLYISISGGASIGRVHHQWGYTEYIFQWSLIALHITTQPTFNTPHEIDLGRKMNDLNMLFLGQMRGSLFHSIMN